MIPPFPVLFSRPALWTPYQLGASLIGWHDAQDSSTITLNAGNIASWGNKASIGGAATQSTGANQPAYSATGFNGLPSYVGAAGKYLDLPAVEMPSGGQARYIFVVLGSTGTTAQNYYIGSAGATSTSWTHGYNAYPAKLLYTDTGSGNIGPGIALGLLNFVGVGYAGSGGSVVFYQQGVLTYTSGTINANTASGIGSIGRWPFFGSAWVGPIAEVVILNSNLSSVERQKLEGYAAWRWWLQGYLPADHPYKGAPPYV